MPTYSFHDTKKDIKFDKLMSIAERTKFLNDNSHIIQLISSPFVGDPIRQGVTKLDDDYKNLLKGIKKETGSTSIEI